MVNAMDCLIRLKEEMVEPFASQNLDLHRLVNATADCVKFEQFCVALDKLVFQGLKELASEPQNAHATQALAELVAQSTFLSTPFRDTICPKEQHEKEKDLLIGDRISTCNLAGLFLAAIRRWKLYIRTYACKCDKCTDIGKWRPNIVELIDLSDRTHSKAITTLRMLSLWNSLPDSMRHYASFLSPDLQLIDSIDEYLALPSGISDCLGRTPLLYFLDCSEGPVTRYLNVVNLLHDLNERDEGFIQSLSKQDIMGRTALHVACQKGYTQLVSKLLELGASPWLQTATGSLPLHYAAAKGYTEICSELLRKIQDGAMMKDKCNMSPLDYAGHGCHFDTAICLVKNGTFYINQEINGWQSLLECAALYGAIDLVKCLLVHRSDQSTTTNKHLFSHLVQGQSIEIMRLLGQLPAVIVDERSYLGRTPLSEAAQNGFLGGVDYLSDRLDVDINSQDDNGWTPLMFAVYREHEKVVELLIRKPHTRLDLESHSGMTALEMSSNNKITSMIEKEMLRRSHSHFAFYPE
jgi:ankyrin repeat protein